MNFCPNCGTARKNDAKFCCKCGLPMTDPAARKRLPLSCILAYIPMLFWLPLAAESESPLHRRCANQGLWLTILSVVSGICLLGMGIGLSYSGLIDFTAIYGQGLQYWLAADGKTLLYCAVFGCLILFFVLFTPVHCICGMIRGFHSDKPHKIPVFGKIHLIREFV